MCIRDRPKRSRARKSDTVDTAEREEKPKREDKPKREAREPRQSGQEERKPRRRNQDDEPVAAGEWNGPKPEFLAVGFN